MKKFLASLFALMMMLSAALADEPAMIDATNAPSIPVGTLSASLVSFTSNQTYAVYSAPDSKSIRGAKTVPASAPMAGFRCLAARAIGFLYSTILPTRTIESDTSIRTLCLLM